MFGSKQTPTNSIASFADYHDAARFAAELRGALDAPLTAVAVQSPAGSGWVHVFVTPKLAPMARMFELGYRAGQAHSLNSA